MKQQTLKHSILTAVSLKGKGFQQRSEIAIFFYLRQSREVLERFELLGWWGDEIGIPPGREVRTGRKESRICLSFLSSDLGYVISVWGGIPSTMYIFAVVCLQAAGH